MEDKLSVFRWLCRDYGDAAAGYGTDYDENEKCAFFAVYGRTVAAEIVYRKKGDTLVPPGTLYCRIYPRKAQGIFIIMPEVFPYAGITEYRACVFPYIESADRMRDCFAALTGILEEHLPRIEDAFADPAGTALRRWLTDGGKTDDPDGVLAGDEAALDAYVFAQGVYEEFILARYLQSKGYYAFLNGDRESALKYYRKAEEKGRLSPFEESLFSFLRSPESDGFRPVSDECFAWRDFKSVSSPKNDGIAMLKSFLILYAVFSAVCCGILAVMNAVLSQGTAAYFGAPWAVGFIGGGLPAVFGALAFRRRLIPLVAKKHADRALAFDRLINAPWVNRLACAAFAAAAALSLFFTAAMGWSPLRLYDTYGDCPHPDSGSPFPPRLRFEYEDIGAVYYISARYNPYGGRVGRPSYVLLMKDGTVIDFDMAASVEDMEREALPILEELGFQVIRVDSDRDLPGMNEY